MITVELGPPPAMPISTNESNRLHHHARSRALGPWKERAWGVALAANLRAAVAGTPCTVRVRIPFATSRRRDPSNYVGTVVKAVVDGLVQAKVWPDDTPAWVTVLEPELVVDPSAETPAAVILEERP